MFSLYFHWPFAAKFECSVFVCHVSHPHPVAGFVFSAHTLLLLPGLCFQLLPTYYCRVCVFSSHPLIVAGFVFSALILLLLPGLCFQLSSSYCCRVCVFSSHPLIIAGFVFSAQLQQLANQPNGQTRMDTERRLQKQKQTVEAQLSQKAQELLQHRMVRAGETILIIIPGTVTPLYNAPRYNAISGITR